MTEKPVRGVAPPEEDLEWLELMREARKTSLAGLTEAAKQLIGVAPILSGLYAAALSFAKIQPIYWQAHPDARYIFTAPILLWLISLIAGVVSLYPQPYSYNPASPEEAKTTYVKLASTKHRWLTVGLTFLILSILALLVAVWTYLGILASGTVAL